MKKLPILLAATSLVASVGASAQLLHNDAAPFAVNIPNLKSGFEFNIEGLFLKPSNSDLDYGFVTDSDRAVTNLLTIKPDTDFAFGAGIGYVFPNSGNNVQLNWTGFNHTDNNTFTLQGNGDLTAPFGYRFDNEDNDDTTKASTAAQFKLSAIDLDAGQYVDVGNRLQMRLFAGLRFARVESNLRDRYTELDTGNQDEGPEDLAENDSFRSKFSGIGPRLGADATYNLASGFAAVGHVATSLLVGRVDSNSSFAFYDYNDDSESGSLIIGSEKLTRVVPAIDAKLGLSYNYTFDCDSVVTLEGGYKASQYIDAVDRLKAESRTGVVTRSTSSLGFSGPYVKLAVKL